MIRLLKRAVKRALEALPVVPVCRFLGRRRLAGIPIVLCIDVEPDNRMVDREGARPWLGFERVIQELVPPLRQELTRLAGEPVGLTWGLRMDPQVAETWGSAAWVVETHGSLFAGLEQRGDELGLHAHLWRWEDETDGWITDYDPAWGQHCVTVALDAFDATLGRSCRIFRGGDGALSAEVLGTLRTRGITTDLTLEYGLPPWKPLPGERANGVPPDYSAVPIDPYRSSPDRFPAPDPTGDSDPFLIPLVGGPLRRGRWARTLVLGTHPTFFAVRMLGTLIRRSPRVLVFALRTDPDLARAWGPVSENLRHLARHPGARFVTATDAADALERADRHARPFETAA